MTPGGTKASFDCAPRKFCASYIRRPHHLWHPPLCLGRAMLRYYPHFTGEEAKARGEARSPAHSQLHCEFKARPHSTLPVSPCCLCISPGLFTLLIQSAFMWFDMKMILPRMPSNRRKRAWDGPLMSGRKRKSKAKQLVTNGIHPQNISDGLRRQCKIPADGARGFLGTTEGLGVRSGVRVLAWWLALRLPSNLSEARLLMNGDGCASFISV